MSCVVTNFLILVAMATMPTLFSQELEAVQRPQDQIVKMKEWVQSHYNNVGVPLNDCLKFYNESEFILSKLLISKDNYTVKDANIWLSGVLAYHMDCLDGLSIKDNFVSNQQEPQILTNLINDALASYAQKKDPMKGDRVQEPTDKLLVSWDQRTSKADFRVAQDGSGTHTSINDAVQALAKMGTKRPDRAIIHVKAGIYKERVEIQQKMTNIMFVGDGSSKTIITGNNNVNGSGSLLQSATFVVSADGFWARDITFQNTAGPSKGQALALMVRSDKSVFYKCSLEGFQDTLYVAAMRQFYSQCDISGTIDFIFGYAAAVFQDCNIYLKRPLHGQSNVITAQGRTEPYHNTGITIQRSRIKASKRLRLVQDKVKSYLGRPWKAYSRTVVMGSYIDGVIHPSGWLEWERQSPPSTLYYAEYKNRGNGSSTDKRVNWVGFHVLNNDQEANQFTAEVLIQGDLWIPQTGVPFWSGL